MHEFSIVRSLLRQVTEIAGEESNDDPSTQVSSISISVGPLSGVEPTLMQIAFAQLAGRYGLEGAMLEIVESELRAVCSDCQHDFAVESFKFLCPSCDSRHVRVESGDAVMLLEIGLEEVSAGSVSQ